MPQWKCFWEDACRNPEKSSNARFKSALPREKMLKSIIGSGCGSSVLWAPVSSPYVSTRVLRLLMHTKDSQWSSSSTSLKYDPIVPKDSRCFEEFGHCSRPLSIPVIFARGFKSLMPKNTQTAKGYDTWTVGPKWANRKRDQQSKCMQSPFANLWRWFGIFYSDQPSQAFLHEIKYCRALFIAA